MRLSDATLAGFGADPVVDESAGQVLTAPASVVAYDPDLQKIVASGGRFNPALLRVWAIGLAIGFGLGYVGPRILRKA